MGCIFAAFMSLFPRLAFFLVWVARPEKVDAAFDTFLIPFFGIFLMPFTTLIYVVMCSREVSRASTGSGWGSPRPWTSPTGEAPTSSASR